MYSMHQLLHGNLEAKRSESLQCRNMHVLHQTMRRDSQAMYECGDAYKELVLHHGFSPSTAVSWLGS